MSGLRQSTPSILRRRGVPLLRSIHEQFSANLLPVLVATVVAFFIFSTSEQQAIGTLFTDYYSSPSEDLAPAVISNSDSDTCAYNCPATATRRRIINFRWDLDIMMDGARNFDRYYVPWSWGKYPKWRINANKVLACRTQTERKPTFPLVTGDGFRCLADVLIDETTDFKMKIQSERFANTDPNDALKIFNRWMFPQEIDEDDVDFNPVVFVKADRDQEGQFFKEFHGNFSRPYVLITHNSDIPIPSKSSLKYTNESKLVHWFGQNKQAKYNRKIWALPIGFSNLRWGPSFSANLYERAARAAMHMQKEKMERKNETEKLLLASFTPRTESRTKALKHAEQHAWATVSPLSYDRYQDAQGSKSSDELHFSYLMDVAQYKFAYSPKGNGLDCHRTYELLLLGVIPILEESTINEMFMPPYLPLGAVLIVQDWEEVTVELLKNHWGVYKPSLLEKRISGDLKDPIIPKILTQRYWMDLIYDKARIEDDW